MFSRSCGTGIERGGKGGRGGTSLDGKEGEEQGKAKFPHRNLEGGRWQPAWPHRWPPIMTPCHPTRLERLRVSQVSVKGTGAGVRMDKARPVHKGLQTKPRGNADSGTCRTQEDTLEGVGREYLGWRGPLFPALPSVLLWGALTLQTPPILSPH